MSPPRADENQMPPEIEPCVNPVHLRLVGAQLSSHVREPAERVLGESPEAVLGPVDPQAPHAVLVPGDPVVAPGPDAPGLRASRGVDLDVGRRSALVDRTIFPMVELQAGEYP